MYLERIAALRAQSDRSEMKLPLRTVQLLVLSIPSRYYERKLVLLDTEAYLLHKKQPIMYILDVVGARLVRGRRPLNRAVSPQSLWPDPVC
jgi:hypothetical protein